MNLEANKTQERHPKRDIRGENGKGNSKIFLGGGWLLVRRKLSP